MKLNRNYRFVLTVIKNSALESGEMCVDNCAVTGERTFVSECHYYAEKNILENMKDAAKRNDLAVYVEHTYCIYKEDKPKKEVIEYEKDGKKIAETREIPGAAMLVEVITVDSEGNINIR